MKAHAIMHDLPRSERGDEQAWIHPADPKSVLKVLEAPVETGDGRSDWCWLRLPNGDLMLGVFPQGETYEEVEEAVAKSYTQGFPQA